MFSPWFVKRSRDDGRSYSIFKCAGCRSVFIVLRPSPEYLEERPAVFGRAISQSRVLPRRISFRIYQLSPTRCCALADQSRLARRAGGFRLSSSATERFLMAETMNRVVIPV